VVDEELAFTPATELLELIATKRVSPVELTELYYSRIDRLDSQLNSYLLLTRETAMAEAKAAEQAVMRGDELGALHGLPMAIKDTQATKGVTTTSGSLVFKDRVPDDDATVVARVKQAGGIMLGKTNTPEFGLVGTCENRLGDDGRNPWNTDRTPGGSSGGAAAAMASCLCPLATGGDGAGSIRIPASFCGIYGIKPTQGRVSLYNGVPPTTSSPFVQQGPLSRTVRDSALLLQVMAGRDPKDPTSMREPVPDFLAALDKDIKGLRVGWSPDFGFAAVDPEVLEVTSKAAQVFEELGCHVEDSDLVMDSPYDAYGPIYETSAYGAYNQYLESHGDQMTEFARYFIEAGSKVTGVDFARAVGLIEKLKGQMTDLFEDYDLLLSPTLALPAMPVGEYPEEIAGRPAYPHRYFSFHPFTYPINAIGHTAASIPAGFSSDGLPIGLQIVGRKGAEETVLAASAAFERARPWIQHRPPVS
jgi:aspartyl-tRNA(Asn)/glutamyl-tRNA(Gln) amidotransferase subunit A